MVKKKNILKTKLSLEKYKHPSTCKCPDFRLLIFALIAAIIFLFFELVVRIYGLYKGLPDVDILSHLLAGLALGAGSYWVLSVAKVKKIGLFAIVLTFLASIIWEAFEALEEVFIINPPYLQDFFFWDGFFDIIVAVIGAIIYLGILETIKKRAFVMHN